jgi:hypothetical protein
VEVHGFLAGDLQRVVNTQAGRFRRIDPPGESRKPLRNRQRIIVDDIVDTPGSAVSAATVAATASSM